MPRGRLRPEDERRIQTNYPYLLENLDQIHDLTAYMYSKKAFTIDDFDEIKNAVPPTRKQKAEMFLQKLIFGGQEAYGFFIEALIKCENDHIVTQLNSTDSQGATAGAGNDDFSRTILPEEFKDKPLLEKDLNIIAAALGKNWESLMIHLGVKSTMVHQAKQQYMHTPLMQIFWCLNKWRQMKGHQATAGALRDALLLYENVVEIDWETIKNAFHSL